MTKLQKLIGIVAAFTLAIGLSACTVDGDNKSSGQTTEFTATLNDGTQVPCVRIDGMHGFDCNWDKAVRTPAVKP